MAPPYVQLVSPSAGITAGNQLVEIRGFRFRTRTPTTIGPRTGPRAQPAPTVRVLFGDREARNVQVIGQDILRVLSPRHPPSAWAYEATDGRRVPAPPPYADPAPVAPPDATYVQVTDGTVDITVQNLDDDGVPIPGEEYVAANAFTFRRPRLDRPGTWLLLLDGLANELHELITPNVAMNPSLDYDVDTGGLAGVTGLAQLPGVAITTVDIAQSENTDQGQREITVDEDAGIVALQRRPMKRDFRANLVIVADNMDELINLAEIVDTTFDAGVVVQIPADNPDEPPHEYAWIIPGGITIPERTGRGELLIGQASLLCFEVTSLSIPGASFDGPLAIPSWLSGSSTVGLTRTAKVFCLHVVPKINE
jgi:hypothetical protein